MSSYKISVLIITKDRPLFLNDCLKSLFAQTIKPYEVVVVDSSKIPATKLVCNTYGRKLNISYKREDRLGIAYARNKALVCGKGDVLVFIDDDCVADQKWLENINHDFSKDANIDVLLGRCQNSFPHNIYAIVHSNSAERWLMENFSDIDQKQTVNAKNFCDFENVAFKKSFVKGYQCSNDLPFGGWNEDREFGYRMADKGKFMYNPEMLVYHKHQTVLWPLLLRNFYQGVANEHIKQEQGIKASENRHLKSKTGWNRICRQTAAKFSMFEKGLFWATLFIYPLPYKLGCLSYKINKLFTK